ncbi:agmatinase family protein [Psychrobacillus sp.]|uniref:agmatinase family protein n=1 Tax=Psychrobacillus sp. TaxID=1871623 RepID=UPI0028BEE61A|nr:agmatinase family protein [Psychrobacillus sp.]
MKLVQPEWQWKKEQGTGVHQWIEQNTSPENPDVVLFTAPISRSSISVSGASQYPDAFRRGWKGFSVYNLDENIDLSTLQVTDLGDVPMHTTDIIESHRRIEAAAEHISTTYSNKHICLIGGDHSVTACSIRGVQKAFPNEKIGIIQLDTHLDVRDPAELGPANGTPIRQLIEGGIVEGKHIYNIGLHGFFNAPELVQYANAHGIHMITLRAARKQGIIQTIREVMEALNESVDHIYVTVDMDVLDISVAPGVPASTPGGMTAYELFDALLEIGQAEKAKHIDFVCLDPTRDTLAQATVKIGVYTFLQWLTGIQLIRQRKGSNSND